MKILTSTVMSLTFGLALFGDGVEASAVPLVSPANMVTQSSTAGTNAVQVRMFRRFGGRRDGGFGGGGDSLGVGIGIGILGGLLLSNALSNNDYAEGSCSQRFRSYDPRSETYLGNDGRRHHCS